MRGFLVTLGILTTLTAMAAFKPAALPVAGGAAGSSSNPRVLCDVVIGMGDRKNPCVAMWSTLGD